jgi:endonuclease G
VTQRQPSRDSGPAASRFGALTPGQQALIKASCYGGLPVNTGEASGTTELIIRQGYVLEHSSVDKIPLWVCESVAADHLRGHLVRSNRFKADPDLKGPKAYPNDYVGSGYDRGHQAPAGNQTIDSELKDQTFYMSNMAPQRPSLNRGIWRLLEDKTRAWVFRYGRAYEWTGPIRCAPKLPPPPDTLGCQRQTIGEHGVAVPLYFYKIILVQDQSTWKAIAFVLPNTDFKRPYRLESYITSIDWIEKETGVEFMPTMSARERRALNASVSEMWP